MESLLEQAERLYGLPLLELISQAHTVHRAHHQPEDIQRCKLLSIKTGGCPEDCGYCRQSAHFDTGLEREALLPLDRVKYEAKRAKAEGAQRFCMGAAWRHVRDGAEFDRVLEMVRAVKAEGLEACVTLGMLTLPQAQRLKEAGLDAYNHNLDTSREHYSNIIHTHTYDDRLNTLRRVRAAGITICCGGILGLGETVRDRCAMLAELAAMDPPPESVPINLRIPAKGVPLENEPVPEPLELVRTVAVARILMPKTRVRLAAGRMGLSQEAQILAFFAGANSLFLGDVLLTLPNPSASSDRQLFEAAGIAAG